MGTTEARIRLVRLCTVAGVPVKGLHGLQRGKAVQLRRAGAPKSAFRALGGWKTTAMIERYANSESGDRSGI
jgi:hypothetical protein